MMKHVLSNRFIQGGAVLMLANLLVSLSNYVFHSLAARQLAPEGYGEIAAMFSYVVLLSFPTGVLAELLIQKLGKNHKPEELAGNVLQLLHTNLRKYWYIGIGLLLLIPLMPRLTNLSMLPAYLIIPLLILSFFSAIYDGALQGLHRFRIFAGIGLISALVKLAGPLVSLSQVSMAFAIIFSAIAGSYVTKFLLNYRILKQSVTSEKVKPLSVSVVKLLKSKQLWLTILSTAAIAGLQNIDIIFVKHRFNGTDAGLYAGWQLFSKLIIYIFGPLITLSYIYFSSKKDEKYHQLTMIIALLCFVLVGISSNLVYGMFARPMIELLLGTQYLVILPYLEWASIYGTLTALIMFLNYYFLAKEKRMGIIFFFSLPFYIFFLVTRATLVTDVIYVSVIYSFCLVGLFLLAFLYARFKHLISIFRS